MEETYQTPSREETGDLIDESYRKRSSASFLKAVKLATEDPIEPVDAKGKRRLHPLLWTVALAIVSALGVILYFTFKS